MDRVDLIKETRSYLDGKVCGLGYLHDPAKLKRALQRRMEEIKLEALPEVEKKREAVASVENGAVFALISSTSLAFVSLTSVVVLPILFPAVTLKLIISSLAVFAFSSLGVALFFSSASSCGKELIKQQGKIKDLKLELQEIDLSLSALSQAHFPIFPRELACAE